MLDSQDNPNLSALWMRFNDALDDIGTTKRSTAIGPRSVVFEELVVRYGEPHRHYHTLCHVEASLAWLERCLGDADRPAEVALALWFHDAIYNPRACDNEQKSADLAEKHLKDLNVDPKAIQRIKTHILATRDHGGRPGDSRLVIDLDLAVLGASPAKFGDFEQCIRREYAHVPDLIFRMGRCRILRRFLRREEIYCVDTLRERLEAKARANLKGRIWQLFRGRVEGSTVTEGDRDDDGDGDRPASSTGGSIRVPLVAKKGEHIPSFYEKGFA